LQAPAPVRNCPLCNEPSKYDDFTEFYYCNHCDQFVQWMPDSYAALMIGPPGAGKTPSLHYWIDFYLRNNRPVILLAFDDFPSNLRGPLGAYTSGKLPEYESSGLATLVDCYASMAGVPSQEKYALKNRADLNELSLLITELLNEKAKLGSTKIILDSATPLFTYKDPQLVLQFLASIAVKTKAKGGAFAVSVTSGTINEEVAKRLETLMDFSLELRFIEVEGRKKRQMRIAKARGQQVYEEWVPIYIGNKAISIDVGDDAAKYERLRKALYGRAS
jgi:KaiC/GvpD/RAD55 family RecA-like ATPase